MKLSVSVPAWFSEEERRTGVMTKRGHSEEQILRVLRGGGVGGDGGGGLPQARDQPAEF